MSAQRRFRAWWLARLPLADQCLLTQRNVYIVPTKAGFALLLTLGVMLVTSINYQLSLGYGLTFLLAGAALASLWLTHANLRGITVHVRGIKPTFAGEPADVAVVIDPAGRARHALALAWLSQPGEAVWVDATTGAQTQAELRTTPSHRGWHALDALRISTRFPLGLFVAWAVWRPAQRLLAYPAPEQPPAPLPSPEPTERGERARRAAAQAEWDGVRPYQRGDTLRQVAWKKVAASGQWVSREWAASSGQTLWLHWQAARLANDEARIARLTAWVIAAERAGLAHGLALPGAQWAPSVGEAHHRALLQALAVWGQTDRASEGHAA